jgi:hypothetical protein
MRWHAALVAVALAIPTSAAAQAPAPPDRTGPDRTGAEPRPPAPPAPPADESTPALDRIKRRLRTDTPLRDAADHVPEKPTFRTSVTEHVDIWGFWGEPDAVAAEVRPRGGTWHQEFQDMVTPDEFKGFGGGLGNGERLQLAATSLAFAEAMKLLGMGVQQMKQAAHNRTTRKAKEEVQRELEAFYALHPEARPAAPP